MAKRTAKKTKKRESGKARSKRAARTTRKSAPAARRDVTPEREGGPRALWTGTVTFGLVSVPVELFPATRDAGPRLRLLSPDGRPLERRYRCPEHGRDVPWDDVARADETEEGLVVLDDDEIEAAAPRRSRDVEIDAFVDAEEIDATMTETAYVLTPGRGSAKPYRLLADAMEDAGRAGIGTFVLRRRERLVAVVAHRGVLWALALRFRGDLRSAEDLGLELAARAERGARPAFRAALDGLKNDAWTPDDLRDEHREALSAIVERKRKRGVDVVEVEPAEDAEPAAEESGDGAAAPDLLAAIQRRLAALPARPARRGAASGDGERKQLAALTKEELYARAQAARLEGRSRMTKDELVSALSEGA